MIGSLGMLIERTHVPKDDTQIDVVEEFNLGVLVCEPERDWHDEAKQVTNCDPLVASADGEHVAGNGPGDGKGIVLLDVLAGPDVRAFNRRENRELIRNDGLHHNVVEDGSNDGSCHLGGEGTLWRQVDQLSNLEITAEPLSLLHSVEPEDGEVHVGQGLSWV